MLFLIWGVLAIVVAFDTPTNPDGPLTVAVISGFLVAFLPYPIRRQSLKGAAIAIYLYGLFLGGVYAIRDAPLGRYKSAYSSIHVGMTLAEVEEGRPPRIALSTVSNPIGPRQWSCLF